MVRINPVLLRVFSSHPSLVAGSYLLAALLFAVSGYANFPIWIVVLTMLLFTAAPLVMLFTLRTGATRGGRASWVGAITATITGFLLLLLHASSVSVWSDYYSNYSYQRLENGDGYHNDSAFHVAIVQGILRTGYPTVGQHFEPVIGYHTASHFADALALQILNIDPWESYGLLFFAKGAAVSVALIYFAAKVTRDESASLFYVVLSGTAITVTSNWRIIGSHGEWLPFLVLILAAPSVAGLLRGATVPLAWLGALTGIVIVLGLGKISLGFSVAVLVGFWLLLNHPRDARIYLFGAVWALFFALFGSNFRAGTMSVGFDRFAESWPEIWGAVILVALMGLLGRSSSGSKSLRNGARAGGIGLLIVSALSVVALNTPTDVFYLFHGICLTLFLFAVPHLMSVFNDAETLRDRSMSSSAPSLAVISFAATILVAAGPVFATGAYSPFRSLEAMAVGVAGTNTVTYGHLNAADGATRVESITKRLLSMQASPAPNDAGFFLAMKREVGLVADAAEREGDDPLLFLTREDFTWLAQESRASDYWSVSLLIGAVTGLPLLHGVGAEGLENYGFRDYGPDALQLTVEEAGNHDLCRFGRPVIVAKDLANLVFADVCTVRPPTRSP